MGLMVLVTCERKPTLLLGPSHSVTFPDKSFTNLDVLYASKTTKCCILRNYCNHVTSIAYQANPTILQIRAVKLK